MKIKKLKKIKARFTTYIKNKFFFFPSVKIRHLERQVSHYEAKLKEVQNGTVKSLVELLEMADDAVRAKKKPHTKDYIRWKSLFRKKLIIDIGCCEKCGITSRLLTIDHIIPADFLRSMGIDPATHMDKRNFRLLCDLCNSRKGHFFDFTDPRTKPLLREYLEDVPDAIKAPNFPQPPY